MIMVMNTMTQEQKQKQKHDDITVDEVFDFLVGDEKPKQEQRQVEEPGQYLPFSAFDLLAAAEIKEMFPKKAFDSRIEGLESLDELKGLILASQLYESASDAVKTEYQVMINDSKIPNITLHEHMLSHYGSSLDESQVEVAKAKLDSKLPHEFYALMGPSLKNTVETGYPKEKYVRKRGVRRGAVNAGLLALIGAGAVAGAYFGVKGLLDTKDTQHEQVMETLEEIEDLDTLDYTK